VLKKDSKYIEPNTACEQF
jgi:hypothetical protein